MAAVQACGDECPAHFNPIASAAQDPISAARVILATIADADGGTRGCFFVNSVTELAPHDAELAACSQGRISRVAALVADSLVRAGFASPLAEERASAALAQALESHLEAD
ncbi:MAG: hypothetical protein H7273_06270 [Polaromonas sp.]|nr:hypothetical protein [Polaromonas sp.]